MLKHKGRLRSSCRHGNSGHRGSSARSRLSAHFNEVFFNDVIIPVENVVGEINEGWAVTRTVLSSEAGMIGSGAGGSNVSFSAYLVLRGHGRTEDLSEIRLRLADAYARAHAATSWSAHAVIHP